LRDTAARAQEFAAPWGAAKWGYWTGLWHDLGKHSKDFQNLLYAPHGADAHCETQPRRVDHSTAGLIHAMAMLPKESGLSIALAVAGHHAGLPDLVEGFKPRLAKKALLEASYQNGGNAAWLKPSSSIPSPPFLAVLSSREEQKRALDVWTRFLFSALVDADFLDTEKFYEPSKAGKRGIGISLTDLLTKLETVLQEKVKQSPGTGINLIRNEILAACRHAAKQTPGVFSLTAPTGAGKTLSGMAFALHHAAEHGLKRVIVVLPYTSIIEQSARVYRDIFEEEAVVEHHSNLDPEHETARNRLASENWDAPIIVTTTVQFFESLFANRSSACRKLHNIARTVVILDEAQALPIGLLAPILDMLRELVRGYGISLLISTATQPAFARREKLPWGFDGVREIVPEPSQTFAKLRRVRIHWPAQIDAPTPWPQLAEKLVAHARVLAIVHRRQDARDLTRLLPAETVHLSASMCAAHRLATIERIRNSLAAKEPIRVVSTQLVEAGVDIDFPVVYRALAGLDAIAQSAGRCNREGKLTEGGCHIFVAESAPPKGVLSKALDVTRTMLNAHGNALDPFSPEPFDEFFRSLYQLNELDQHGIQRLRENLSFEEVAKEFKMIEDEWRIPVVVPYGDVAKCIEALRSAAKSVGFIPADTLRALQPYTVSTSPKEYDNLERCGAVEIVEETVKIVLPYFRRVADGLPLYDERFGLVADGELCRDPKTLMT